MAGSPEVRIFADTQALGRALAGEFLRQSRARIAAAGRFSVALAGGSTPRPVYALLGEAWRDEVPWSGIEFFWSDERAVPLDHADSNYRLARETLLAHARAAGGKIHAMVADPDDPDASARRYEARLREVLGPVPALDWMLLGLGPDGHVASLFPGAPALHEPARSVVVVRDSPKPPPLRLTMTLPLINRSGAVHILVTGAGKSAAVRSTLHGDRDPDRWPAQAIAPAHGTLTWWLDQAAAAGLSRP